MPEAFVRRRRGRTEGGEAGERLPLLARIRIDHDIPSLNEVLSSHYKRRKTVAKITQEWRDKLWLLQVEQLGPDWMEKIQVEVKHPCRRLEIIRRCKKKRDRDGMWGGTKPVVDALKSENIRFSGKVVGRRAGWFYDDNETYLDLKVNQIVTGEEPWVELILYGEAVPKEKKKNGRTGRK